MGNHELPDEKMEGDKEQENVTQEKGTLCKPNIDFSWVQRAATIVSEGLETLFYK